MRLIETCGSQSTKPVGLVGCVGHKAHIACARPGRTFLAMRFSAQCPDNGCQVSRAVGMRGMCCTCVWPRMSRPANAQEYHTLPMRHNGACTSPMLEGSAHGLRDIGLSMSVWRASLVSPRTHRAAWRAMHPSQPTPSVPWRAKHPS